MFRQSKMTATNIPKKKNPPIQPAVKFSIGTSETSIGKPLNIVSPNLLYEAILLLIRWVRSFRGKFHPIKEVGVAVTRSTVPTELHERYGLKPRNPILLTSVWGLASLIFIYLFLQVNGGQQEAVETRLISWEIKSENLVEVTWTLYQRDDLPVTCTIKAQDSDQFDVGFALFKTKDTASVPQFTHELLTLEGAFAVLTPTCELDESRLLGTHFRPGLLPPAQNSPLFAPWQWNS